MSKQKIRWIIGCMSLALLGLMAFQAYWLDFMLQTKKDQFIADVRDGMEQVVRKLEKQELYVLAAQKQAYDRQQQIASNVIKKLAVKQQDIAADIIVPEPPPPPSIENRFLHNEVSSDIMVVRKQFVLPNGQIAEITEEYQVDRDPEQEIRQKLMDDAELNRMLAKTTKAAPKKPRITNKRDLSKIGQKTEMAKEVFADFLFKERPIQKRVEPHYIDSLIRLELAKKNIRLSYAFGIAPKAPKTPNAQWIYASAPSVKKQVSYATALFPNDLQASGQYLHILFPNQSDFIWQSMGLNLVGSALLLFIMIACFYIAVMTILKQKKLAEIKNDFINNMTHEFKTPISTISLATQLIQEEPQVAQNESISRYLGIIKDENMRLGQQVERVLQTAQMEREEIVLVKKQVDLHDLIRQVADMNGPLLEAHGGKLTLDLAAAESLISVDEVHITNVLNNLLDNAIKYSSAKPLIHIASYRDRAGLHISVADQGIGMAKEVLNAVFEPFYRVPTGNVHNVKGFGLGLSYVKKIVEAHGGEVHVTSKLGVGSTFECVLPDGKNNEHFSSGR